MLRHTILLLLIFILAGCGARGLVAAPAVAMPDLPEQVEMHFIHAEICASCDGTEEFRRVLAERLEDVSEKYPFSVSKINIYETGGRQRFELISRELLGVESYTLSLPVLIMGGQAYQGMDNIERNLREAYLTAGNDLFVNRSVFNPRYRQTDAEWLSNFEVNPDHLTLVYFYRVVCPGCIELEPFLESLAETVEIDGMQVPVDIIRINTRSGNNRDRILAFFEAYQVPDEDRMVPIIFTAYGYYAGAEGIIEMLETGLANLDKLGFRFP